MYRQTSNISHILIDKELVDRSDVVGSSPVVAAPATSSFFTLHLASMDWAKTTAGRDDNHLSVGLRFYGMYIYIYKHLYIYIIGQYYIFYRVWFIFHFPIFVCFCCLTWLISP